MPLDTLLPRELKRNHAIESGWSTMESHIKVKFFITIYIVINDMYFGEVLEWLP